MIFLDHPSTWMLAAVVLVTVCIRKPTRAAAAGLVCYVLSFAVSNAYSYVPYVEAVLLWQGGLLALLVIYGIAGRKWWQFFPAAAFLGAYAVDYITRYTFEFAISVLAVAVVSQIYTRISRNDILAGMVWGIVLVFEGWSAIEIPGCRFFAKIDNAAEMWRTTGESVCAIAFGEPAPYFITGVTLTLLMWTIRKWNQSRPGY